MTNSQSGTVGYGQIAMGFRHKLPVISVSLQHPHKVLQGRSEKETSFRGSLDRGSVLTPSNSNSAVILVVVQMTNLLDNFGGRYYRVAIQEELIGEGLIYDTLQGQKIRARACSMDTLGADYFRACPDSCTGRGRLCLRKGERRVWCGHCRCESDY